MTQAEALTGPALVARGAAEVLGLSTVERGAPLWRLGFDSLAALRLVQWLYSGHGVRLRADAVLRAETPEAIAALVTESPDVAQVPTDGQQSLWLDEQLRPGHAMANVVLLGYRLGVDPVAALHWLVERHDALRTTVTRGADGRPFSTTLATSAALRVATFAEETPQRQCVETLARSVDLARGPIIAAGLRGGDLLLAVHHAAFDGHSEAVLAEELSAFLRGERPPPPRPFLEVAGAVVSVGDGLAEWAARLAATHQLTWPGPGGDAGCGRLGGEPEPRTFLATLRSFGRAVREVTGVRSFRVAVPTSGRDDPASHGTIGYFVRPAVVPLGDAELDGPPEALARTWEQAARWSSAGLRELSAAIRRAGGRGPLYQALLAWQNTIPVTWRIPGTPVTDLEPAPLRAQTDLAVQLWPGRSVFVDHDRARVPEPAATAIRDALAVSVR